MLAAALAVCLRCLGQVLERGPCWPPGDHARQRRHPRPAAHRSLVRTWRPENQSGRHASGPGAGRRSDAVEFAVDGRHRGAFPAMEDARKPADHSRIVPGPNCGGRPAARSRRNQNTNRNNTSSTAMTKAMMAIIRVFTGALRLTAQRVAGHGPAFAAVANVSKPSSCRPAARPGPPHRLTPPSRSTPRTHTLPRSLPSAVYRHTAEHAHQVMAKPAHPLVVRPAYSRRLERWRVRRVCLLPDGIHYDEGDRLRGRRATAAVRGCLDLAVTGFCWPCFPLVARSQAPKAEGSQGASRKMSQPATPPPAPRRRLSQQGDRSLAST